MAPARNASVPLVSRLLATGFYSGYSPFASGTAGSLVGLLFYIIPGFEKPFILPTLTLAFLIVGIKISAQMEQAFGDDPQIVVIDEIVGMWIALLFLPKKFSIALLAFLLFRLFDIFKPPPARQAERLKNGVGIMLDDVVAGLYANVVLQLFLLVVPI